MSRFARLATVLALVLASLGIASPALAYGSTGLYMDCYTQSASGTTIYLGFDNETGSAQSFLEGSYNHLSTSYTGSLPTSFPTGVHHAVSSVTVSSPTGVSWYVAGYTVTFSSSVPTCGSNTPLPAFGNGSAFALGTLLVALVGGFLFARKLRRASR